ncbi:MAG: hypothetical protein H0U54_10010 [Acidobacteria bacterium]|nr:hypothetical protein [Acidobacteriota bacterium]MBA3806181.1 hypothetical protein [Acidobacteriota bacterium]
MLGVAHDADDRGGRAVAADKFYLPADGVLARPVAAGHHLIDDDDGGRIEMVAVVEEAALNKGDAHGGEIVRRRRVVQNLRLLASGRRLALRQDDAHRDAVAG